jgi:hypothetical protein
MSVYYENKIQYTVKLSLEKVTKWDIYIYDLQVLYLDVRIMSRLTKYLRRLPHSLNWGDKINLSSGLVYIHVFILDFTNHRKFSLLN